MFLLRHAETEDVEISTECTEKSLILISINRVSKVINIVSTCSSFLFEKESIWKIRIFIFSNVIEIDFLCLNVRIVNIVKLGYHEKLRVSKVPFPFIKPEKRLKS